MAKIDAIDISKLRFAEAAAPGTPSAGLVLIYAKSDGRLYAKDDAGNEYDLTAGGGSVATDAIWDAAGDIAVGTGANTAARLAIGAAGGAVSRVNGAVAWNSGTSFPTAATGDRYWRTDLGMEFYYDGTRWLSTSRITIPISTPSSTHFDFSATATAFGRWSAGDEFDLWLEDWVCTSQVLTTNNGTNFWSGDLRKVDHDDGSSTSIASFSTAADAADAVVTKRIAIDAVLGVASNFESGFVSATKTLSPGNYRLIPGFIVARYIGT